MLSEAEEKAIADEVGRYESPRAACIDALKIVQAHRGSVTDEALRDVAARLGMTESELDDVATFYNLIFRRPVGRHVILLCDSVSCWIMGSERLRARLEARLGLRMGGTSADARFTLLPNCCLGVCEQAPALMIDGDLHGDVREEALDELVATYE
jgi:NADH-quinone oxidoreductase subunit E